MGFWHGLWRGRRVVRYDMRGTGLSQRGVGPVSHDEVTLDLEAVVAAAGARDFTLWASTLSGPRAIEFAVRHPKDVRRLVLHRTFARAADLMSRGAGREPGRAGAHASGHGGAGVRGPAGAARSAGRGRAGGAGVQPVRIGRVHLGLFLRGYETTDVTALLPKVAAPTLILHWARGSDVRRDAGAGAGAQAFRRRGWHCSRTGSCHRWRRGASARSTRC